MSHHVFCYPNILIALAVVHLENQADEVGENRRSPRLRLDGRHALASLRPDYRQTARGLVVENTAMFAFERTGQCEGLKKYC